MRANINHGLIVQYPGPGIYNELNKPEWSELKLTQKNLLNSIERNTNEYDDYITCIPRSTKGQDISKAIFLETPLPKK